jgi:hypothetical protein
LEMPMSNFDSKDFWTWQEIVPTVEPTCREYDVSSSLNKGKWKSYWGLQLDFCSVFFWYELWVVTVSVTRQGSISIYIYVYIYMYIYIQKSRWVYRIHLDGIYHLMVNDEWTVFHRRSSRPRLPANSAKQRHAQVKTQGRAMVFTLNKLEKTWMM